VRSSAASALRANSQHAAMSATKTPFRPWPTLSPSFRPMHSFSPVHTPDIANWRERAFGAKVRERFGLPVTEMLLDRDGRVVSVSAE
jgi:hypothetical protein